MRNGAGLGPRASGLRNEQHRRTARFRWAIQVFRGLRPEALGLVLVTALSASAQTSEIPKVELDEAVRRALDKNPTVAQAATAIARAEGLLATAKSLTMPNASVFLNSTTSSAAREFQGVATQPQTQVAFGGSVSMPVFDAARWAGVSQARDQIDISTISLTEARRQMAIAVAQAYLAIIASHRQVEVALRSLESARAHHDYATKRLEGGVGSRLNQLRAAQVVADDESRLENIRLLLRRSQEALGLLAAADGPLDAASEPAFDVGDMPEVDAAIQARSDLQLQAAVRRAAERVVKDTWKEIWPAVTASFDPQVVTPSGLFQTPRTWRFSVNLNQPLYQGGLQRAAVRVRQVAVDQATLALQDLTLRARSEVRLAEESVRLLESSVVKARLAADHASDVLRITTTAFEVGATTNLEVIDAQRSARDAATIAVLAEDAVRRAKLDLLVALGRFPR